MSAGNGPLKTHLASETTSLCHCWRLSRADGVVFGFTDHDQSLVCDGTAFEPETGLTASEAKSSLGLSIDTVDVEGALSASQIREEDILSGLYDGARIETYLVNWRDPREFQKLRVAVIGKVTRRDGSFIAELESEAWALDQPSGRTVRRGCDAELGDAQCRVNLNDPRFSTGGTLRRVEDGGVIVVEGLSGFENGWFDNGTLTWTSGGHEGRKERVVSHGNFGGETRLALWREATLEGTDGDTFTVAAGCDKQFSTCKAKFNNALNFRGFPHLPGDDFAYDYVSEQGVFDGKALVK
ncbi:DUF2163 domain-containing protein [Nitratireductor sp. GISD-1A_MAKvit]|uniref:DUF2163 domain-containing protein n=1 Tax=Nitratireductor sp. GISD-1A_MAKvit TaxID=3234198 RepID=UPI003465D5AD